MPILQNADLFILKQADARNRIDKFMLILVIFDEGVAFGVKFNERQSKPSQWIKFIDEGTLVAGIGDLRDFKRLIGIFESFCQDCCNLLGKPYVTGNGIVNFLSGYLYGHFEESLRALAVNMMVLEWLEKDPQLWFIDFDGRIKQLAGFTVAGGSPYVETLTEEDLKNLSPEEKIVFEFKKKEFQKERDVSATEFASAFQYTRPRHPQKEAIAFLENNWKPDMGREDAVGLLTATLSQCNPPSKDNIIEIMVFPLDKNPEIFHFKKNQGHYY